MRTSFLNTIDGQPSFVSTEQHDQLTQTTPISFESLPPILRLMVDGVTLVLTGIEGRSDWNLSNLKLFLTEREVNFYSDERSQTLVLPYRSISLHAISRPEGQPGSIYCQLDESLDFTQDDQQHQQVEESDAVELQIVPNDSSRLEEIFQVLSRCASLHPSLESGGANGGLGEGWTFGAEGGEDESISEGRVRETDSIIKPSVRYNPY
ncbi:regulator of volume decrease after cellular swelling-domain-containing protein [Phakopsora pachyrhizi]|uniref:Regulator of volume decrease after cellular swelling-domain-containing protein n=1 Tax=Phakopsora pachyrhizi TaxID=170000 RepID=A0AAV0BG90_PHAPC|nr:regulator of volume decrease after cellular swelling-domain-containing protein [Phakopsora pachyrhizi]